MYIYQAKAYSQKLKIKQFIININIQKPSQMSIIDLFVRDMVLWLSLDENNYVLYFSPILIAQFTNNNIHEHTNKIQQIRYIDAKYPLIHYKNTNDTNDTSMNIWLNQNTVHIHCKPDKYYRINYIPLIEFDGDSHIFWYEPPDYRNKHILQLSHNNIHEFYAKIKAISILNAPDNEKDVITTFFNSLAPFEIITHLLDLCNRPPEDIIIEI